MAFTCVAVGQSLPTTQSLVIAGKLDGMRWPHFRDYQGSLREFYEPRAYKPAWIKGTSPSPQALSMIDLFRNAWQKGLEPEDYDASRWDDRLQALRSSTGDPASFDLAMTVCTMRYISDLRIGRINPQHFKFGLSVEQKKYDLAQFLRDRLLTESELAAVVASVEPPFPGYRRTEQALIRYREIARADDSEQLPVPAKPIDPGQTYAGVPRLTRLLQLVGDLPNSTQPKDLQVYDATLA